MVYKYAILVSILIILVLSLSYIILQTQWMTPRINELSASYISLKNTYTTDMLKITNLHKLNDKKGKSFYNKSSKDFQMIGETDYKYQIVLYHLGDSIDEQYVKYHIENEKKIELDGTLSEQPVTYDGGRIIYEGTINEGQNWNLKMWVDKEYQGNCNNVSYEIRIKTS